MANNGYAFTISVNNIDKALALTDELIQTALEACGDQAVTYAVNNITEKGAVQTGNLRNSITWQMDGNRTVEIGTAVEYAVYVEMGTGIYASDGKGRKIPWTYKDEDGNWHTTKGSHPKPYLKPALEEHVDDYKDIFIKFLSGK